MNYQDHYNRLIDRARARSIEGYTEQHHIVPRCMGGTDDSENLVKLTAEEHFVAHQLLVKIYSDVKGLAFACMKMCGNPWGKRPNARIYGWLRKKHSEDTSKRLIGNKHGAGRIQSAEERSMRSLALKGRKKSAAHNSNVQIALKAFRLNNPDFKSRSLASYDGVRKSCTVDGIKIYPSRRALVNELGNGKNGIRSSSFRYL